MVVFVVVGIDGDDDDDNNDDDDYDDNDDVGRLHMVAIRIKRQLINLP